MAFFAATGSLGAKKFSFSFSHLRSQSLKKRFLLLASVSSKTLAKINQVADLAFHRIFFKNLLEF